MPDYLDNVFFDRAPIEVAIDLLGAVLRVQYRDAFLSVRIIETEAYCFDDKASHASLGFTEKKRALFMAPGTIYMYYARGGDTLNISCQGEGSAVLIKAGVPHFDLQSHPNMISVMQCNNPVKGSERFRKPEKLCSGQTLLCRSLGLKVSEWDQKCFMPPRFFITPSSEGDKEYIQTRRLGIPKGRDEDKPYRFILTADAKHATQNPLSAKSWALDQDYWLKNSGVL